MTKMNRRTFVAGTVAGAATLAAPGILRAQAMPSVSWGNLSTGVSVIIDKYIAKYDFAEKHGVDLRQTTPYASIRSYYSDFVAGSFDIAMGTWDSFVARRLGGVPIKLFGMLGDASFVKLCGYEGGISSVDELPGKTMAAPTVSGTYRLAKLLLRDLHGIKLEEDVKIQNVDSPPAAISLVAAEQVDAGLSWETHVALVRSKAPNVRPIYDMAADYRSQKGHDLPFFTLAIHERVLKENPGLADKLTALFDDGITAMINNPEEAIGMAAPAMKMDPEVVKLGVNYKDGDEKLKSFDFASLQKEEPRASIRLAAEFLIKNNVLKGDIDDSIFVS